MNLSMLAKAHRHSSHSTVHVVANHNHYVNADHDGDIYTDHVPHHHHYVDTNVQHPNDVRVLPAVLLHNAGG